MTRAHTLLTLATRLFREQRYEKARRSAQRLLEADPGSPAGWAILGMSQLRLGHREDALTTLLRAHERDPSSLKVREALAESLYQNQRTTDALEHIDAAIREDSTPQRYAIQARLRRECDWPYGALRSEIDAVHLDPDNIALKFRVAHTALNEGDPERADTIIGTPPDALDPEHVLLLAQIKCARGAHREARDLCTRLCATSSDPALQYQAAHLLFQVGPFETAANVFERLASEAHAPIESHTWHARCQLFSNHPDAHNTIASVHNTWPEHPDVLCVVGIHHALQDNEKQAVSCFQQTIERDPTHGEAHLWLGELYRRQGEIPACLTATDTGIFHTPVYCLAGELNRILAIHGRDSIAARWKTIPQSVFAHHIQRAETLVSKDTRDKALSSARPKWVIQASEDILTGLHGNRTGWPTQHVPGTVGATRIHLAEDVRQESRRHQLLLRTRAPQEVLEQFAQLIERYPEPTVYCHRGEVSLWLGHYAAAEADFETALDIDRTTRWAWIGLGASQILTGREQQGLNTFQQSKSHARPGRTMWVYQAEAYRNLGELDRAVTHIQEALRINPERTSAYALAGLLHCDHGRIHDARACWGMLETQNPTLCAHVRSAPHRPDTLEALSAHFADMLQRMHGNRASTVITWMHDEALHLNINDPSDVTAQYGLNAKN